MTMRPATPTATIDLDENTVTAAVNARLEACADPRLKQVVESFTRHLHDFVREVALTEAEWQRAKRFLTDTGQKCSGTRQEFILLSDVLGLSTLCVALNNRTPAGATEATVFGPFHVPDSRLYEAGEDISETCFGPPCEVYGTVRALDGEPVAGAEIEVWHADHEGQYDVQRSDPELRCRGRLRAGADGRFHFRTVRPAAYPIPVDGPVGDLLHALGRHPWRPAHIHFRVRAPGFRTLVTQVFDREDPYLGSDAVFGVRASLLGDFVVQADNAPACRLDVALVLTAAA